MEKGIGSYKFLFDIRLMGASSVLIRPLKIPTEIHDYSSSVIYMCNDGYVFEKRYYDVYYRKNRLILPPFVKENNKIHCMYTFNSCMDRYNSLKLFKRNLIELSKSGLFGDNPYARVITYQSYWYVH